MRYGVVLLAGLLVGCSDISTSPIRTDGIIYNDLLATRYNFEKAVALGILLADDPALACVDGVIRNINAASDESFTPDRAGLLSEGAVIYIRAQQAKKLREAQMPMACDAVVGRLLIDAAKLGMKFAH